MKVVFLINARLVSIIHHCGVNSRMVKIYIEERSRDPLCCIAQKHRSKVIAAQLERIKNQITYLDYSWQSRTRMP